MRKGRKRCEGSVWGWASERVRETDKEEWGEEGEREEEET